MDIIFDSILQSEPFEFHRHELVTGLKMKIMFLSLGGVKEWTHHYGRVVDINRALFLDQFALLLYRLEPIFS